MFIDTWICDIPDDPFNLCNFRNIRNTPKAAYNCAGYALETFDWYLPNGDGDDQIGWGWGFDVDELFDVTDICARKMLEDFPTLRIIQSVSDLAPGEYAIAFRLSSDGDFHYMKRAASGVWYNKCGCASEVFPWPAKWVLDENRRWCNRYDGPIVLFAKMR